MIKANSIPVLNVPAGTCLEFLVATTLILKQYEYFPHVTVNESDIFIDGGGFIGDTAYWAFQQGAKKVYSFEPDQSNMIYLRKNIASFGGEGCVTIVPYGLDKDTGEKFFTTGKGAASKIISTTNSQFKDSAVSTIHTMSLDVWCKQNNVTPTFIKMDIEGAELDALYGAAETIQTHRDRKSVV